jgi:hypothetical protein
VVPVSITDDGANLNVSVAAAKEESPKGEIWLCALTKNVPVAIGRGENRGRTVTYHNVVRRWLQLGVWTGTTQTFTVPKSKFAAEDVDMVAVLVQAGSVDSPSIMLGAASAPLR